MAVTSGAIIGRGTAFFIGACMDGQVARTPSRSNGLRSMAAKRDTLFATNKLT